MYDIFIMESKWNIRIIRLKIVLGSVLGSNLKVLFFKLIVCFNLNYEGFVYE